LLALALGRSCRGARQLEKERINSAEIVVRCIKKSSDGADFGDITAGLDRRLLQHYSAVSMRSCVGSILARVVAILSKPVGSWRSSVNPSGMRKTHERSPIVGTIILTKKSHEANCELSLLKLFCQFRYAKKQWSVPT